nr:hypothetical protein [Tanacetum cinerariifolium]
KLEALTSINVSKVIKKAVQVKVQIEIKKLLPTHVLKAVANYFKPLLNNSVRKVMRNNHISLFTKPSTFADNLSKIDLKIKMLNIIYLNKSNMAHPSHLNIYDTLYDSITLDQEALDAQETDPSFHKRTYDDQDPPNDHEGDDNNKKKRMLKSGSANTKRRTTWFDLLLKSKIDQNENRIFGPSTVAVAKKLKELIHKDELTIANLECAGFEKLKQQYKNDVELEYHVN